MISAT